MIICINTTTKSGETVNIFQSRILNHYLSKKIVDYFHSAIYKSSKIEPIK